MNMNEAPRVFLNIGEAAAASGVSPKMIRHYERLGVTPAPARTPAGYRLYGEPEVQRLRFVRRARDLGFSAAEIRRILALWGERERSNAEVQSLAAEQVTAIERRITHLETLRGALQKLIRDCQGDTRPDFPTL